MAEPDFFLEYNADKSEFRLNDGDEVSDIYPVPEDGVGLVEFGDDDDADLYLVTLYNYKGGQFEPNTVHDTVACETEVREGVDLTVEPEGSGEGPDETEDDEDETEEE